MEFALRAAAAHGWSLVSMLPEICRVAAHSEPPTSKRADASAGFQYRTGGSTYANTVSGGSLANIDAIRIVAQARRRPETGGVDDVTFGWGVNVFLRNGG